MDGYTFPLPGAAADAAAADAAAERMAADAPAEGNPALDGFDGLDGGDYAAHVLASAPLAYYRLDDPLGSSIAHDSSGHGYDCQYAVGAQLGVPGVVPGDTAVRFSASRLGVACDPALFAFRGNEPFTLEGWYQPDSVGQNSQYAASRLTGSPLAGYQVFLGGTPPSVGFEIYQSGNRVCYADGTSLPCAPPTCAQFTHLVATYDGATLSVYLNAVPGVTASCSRGLPDSGNAAFTIGNESGYGCDTCGFNGAIDEVAIYDRALPQREIQDHYAAGGR